jgi:hypothetical protein
VSAVTVVAVDLHQAARWKHLQAEGIGILKHEAPAMHVITSVGALRGHAGPLVVLTGKPLPQELWEAIQVVADTGGTVLWEDPL